jgi:hypothetical protein
VTDPDDDADDVFLLDVIDPDEEPVDVFLLDAIDSDGNTGGVSIGISVVLECCGGVANVCVKTFTDGKSLLSIGFGRDVAIGVTLFIVSSQLCFFMICSSITTPMILNALRISISIFKMLSQPVLLNIQYIFVLIYSNTTLYSLNRYVMNDTQPCRYING